MGQIKLLSDPPGKLIRLLFTVLRITIGWHFLFEGISKLAIPGWSSAPYLMESKWIFSGFFHWIVTNPTALAITDFLNIWGLVLVGTGLFLGLFTRLSAWAGIGMLLFYYVANPPFIPSSIPAQGHFFIININVIEAAVLGIIAFLNRDYLWSLDRLIRERMQRKRSEIFPPDENQHLELRSRREVIRNLASLPLLGVAFFGMARKVGWLSFEEENLSRTDATSSASLMQARRWDLNELKEKAPMGRIKDVEMSRILPGGNLVAGFAHARDLIYVSDMIKNYFTDEKVIENLWLYEACGINTIVFRTDDQVLRIIEKYRKRGGKIQWLAQTYPDGEDFSNIQMAIDAGAVGAFVMGGIADRVVAENRLDELAKPIEFIRSQGLIAGTAAHAIQVPMACVDNGIECDFFMKTFHHDKYWSAHAEEHRSEFMHDLPYNLLDRDQFHDNLWCASAGEVSEFFKTCEVPWIAYKVLAAGAIRPEDGFRYAFENGADFICVGMFDWQVIPNANTVTEVVHSTRDRQRTWYA
jgi:uncharacterized membrane protein YphA (DoxX/SURF4 family)